MSLYIVDTANKNLKPLDGTKLSEQKFKERDDLQEWLVSHPEALGEELLIIQKEFDGFDGTGERLDLLALDTQGHLVLIENKRDDSGRDAVWQALKYASYVAPFTSDDIEDVFAKYLLKNKPEYSDLDDNAFDTDQVHNTAKLLIQRFLENNQETDIQITTLNPRNSQRIILVAGEFRREVTNTALWLLDRDIDVKCVKVSPYMLNGQLLVDIKQIIPVPEASEYMVRLTRKEAEQKSVQVNDRELSNLRFRYWEQLLDFFAKNKNNSFINTGPTRTSWISIGTGIAHCYFNLVFTQNKLRVELELIRKEASENKKLFDFFYTHRQQIEQNFGHELLWLRLDEKISSRIEFIIKVDGYNEVLWPKHAQWHFEHVQKLEQTFKSYMTDVYQVIK